MKTRAKTQSLVVSRPAGAAVTSSIREQIETSPWWSKVDDDSKKVVISEANGLATALQSHGYSNLAIAEHFTHIYKILQPLKLFEKFIKQFNFRRRTVYRYLKSYQNAQRLPEHVLKAALALNMNIMGETESQPYGSYTEAIKKLPLPKKLDDESAVTYLKDIEAKRKQIKTKPSSSERDYVPEEPNDLQIDSYRTTLLAYHKLPRTWPVEKKQTWLKTLAAFQLTIAGFSPEAPIEILPIVPPADFVPKVGRPRSH